MDRAPTPSGSPQAGQQAPAPTPAAQAQAPSSYDGVSPVRVDQNAYPVYARDSAPAQSFRQKFAAEKNNPAGKFQWTGADGVARWYSTKMK
jgi:hypothetical protein